MKTRPWYMFPDRTCRVLNKIASRYVATDDLRRVLDRTTAMLWAKQEAFYSA